MKARADCDASTVTTRNLHGPKNANGEDEILIGCDGTAILIDEIGMAQFRKGALEAWLWLSPLAAVLLLLAYFYLE